MRRCRRIVYWPLRPASRLSNYEATRNSRVHPFRPLYHLHSRTVEYADPSRSVDADSCLIREFRIRSHGKYSQTLSTILHGTGGERYATRTIYFEETELSWNHSWCSGCWRP